MNRQILPAAAKAAKASAEPEWAGYESVAAAIRDMVLDTVECFGFGSHGQRKEAELVPLSELVRVFDEQATRAEIIGALDELQAGGKIALLFSDDGVCAKPRNRPQVTHSLSHYNALPKGIDE